MFSLLLFSFAFAPLVAAKVQFLGVAIAGGDFGCQIDGSCPTGSTQIPLSSLGGSDGEGQMKHFAEADKLNMFRLPISWQQLVNNKPGAELDQPALEKYDKLVQACLATGVYCMIDIHNFARFNGKTAIIGQGGPSDDDFVSLWTQLATKYAKADKIVFELMNEPHDLNIQLWAATCQKVVTAIRNTGATRQMILLPGSNFDSAATLVSGGSAAALMAIKNPDSTTDNILLDVHKYLDEDNSGTHKTCTTDNIAAFNDLATFLRQAGRKAIISETGASSDATCMTSFCAQNAFINKNADVFVGLVVWAAGGFDTSYVLSLTPKKQGNGYVDNDLMKRCVLDTWNNSPDSPVVASSAGSTTLVMAPTVVAPTSSAGPSTNPGRAPPEGAHTPQSSHTTASMMYGQGVPTDTGTWVLTMSIMASMPTSLVLDTARPDVTPTQSKNVTMTTRPSSPTLAPGSGAGRVKLTLRWMVGVAAVVVVWL